MRDAAGARLQKQGVVGEVAPAEARFGAEPAGAVRGGVQRMRGRIRGGDAERSLGRQPACGRMRGRELRIHHEQVARPEERRGTRGALHDAQERLADRGGNLEQDALGVLEFVVEADAREERVGFRQRHGECRDARFARIQKAARERVARVASGVRENRENRCGRFRDAVRPFGAPGRRQPEFGGGRRMFRIRGAESRRAQADAVRRDGDKRPFWRGCRFRAGFEYDGPLLVRRKRKRKEHRCRIIRRDDRRNRRAVHQHAAGGRARAAHRQPDEGPGVGGTQRFNALEREGVHGSGKGGQGNGENARPEAGTAIP